MQGLWLGGAAVNLWRRRHNDQGAAERYADALAEAYREAFTCGRVLCQMGEECPDDRPQFPVTVRESQQAGFFDGWVAAQCEIFDETDEGIRAIEDFLGRTA